MKESDKNFAASIIIGLCFLLTLSCAPIESLNKEESGSSSTSVEETKRFDNSIDLTSHLQRLSGVTVTGKGGNARVRIRGGANSFSLPSDPLFVVNGTPKSGGYASIYNTIDVASIKSIKVLKGSQAALYGARGTNGVIIIDTTL
tara:strand:- start:15382 stop:15816 length:435 start_codon:yes stop_codon:yes gene_type:complete